MTLSLGRLGAAAALLIASQLPAQAQATRTWVSGVGNDANPCSRTAPCRTFAGAISKTAINGEINCLDPGAYGTVTITTSITIDCHEIFASILASGTNGININIPGRNVNDPLRTARIRNININGAGSSGAVGTRTGLRGINIVAANAVFVEDVMIRNFTLFGILDARAAAGALHVNNTTIQDNAGPGIKIEPSAGSPRIDAMLNNVILQRNSDGLFAGVAAKVSVKKSNVSGNTGAGINGTGAGSRIAVDDSLISSNGTGILAGAGASIRVSNSDLAMNTTAKTGGASILSFGNNRLTANTADGAAFGAATQE
jgi:hypothetical protein